MSDFEGRPIEGEVNHYTGELPPQKDPQEFLDALDNLLEVPGVEAVRWQQYTPYFNDGEACEFRIYSAEVKLEGLDEGGDYDDGWREEYGFYDYSKGDYSNRELIEVPGVDVSDVKEALGAFERVLESGEHYVVLNKKFGDPAQVTATTAGFNVEYYDHE